MSCSCHFDQCCQNAELQVTSYEYQEAWDKVTMQAKLKVEPDLREFVPRLKAKGASSPNTTGQAMQNHSGIWVATATARAAGTAFETKLGNKALWSACQRK